VIREFFLEKFLVLFRQRFFVVLSRRLWRIEPYLTPDPACDVCLPREAIQKKTPTVIKSHDFVPEHPCPEGQEHDDGNEDDVFESKEVSHERALDDSIALLMRLIYGRIVWFIFVMTIS
jgi:hypothetical protein